METLKVFFISTLITVGLARLLIGEYDLFYTCLLVVLLVLKLCLIKFWYNQNASEEAEEEEVVNPTSFVIYGSILGIASTSIFLCLSWALSKTFIGSWVYSCEETVAKISILEEGKSYKKIAEVVDERLRQKNSIGCKKILIEKQVRAMINLSEQLQLDQQVIFLEDAITKAEGISSSDLVSLAKAKLEIVKKHLQPPSPQIQSETILLPDLLFNSGSYLLTNEGQVKVSQIGKLLADKNKLSQVMVIGHTDNVGSPESNLKLSKERAIEVANILINSGLNRDIIETQGLGQSTPTVPNTSPENRARNRSVEIIVLTQ